MSLFTLVPPGEGFPGKESEEPNINSYKIEDEEEEEEEEDFRKRLQGEEEEEEEELKLDDEDDNAENEETLRTNNPSEFIHEGTRTDETTNKNR